MEEQCSREHMFVTEEVHVLYYYIGENVKHTKVVGFLLNRNIAYYFSYWLLSYLCPFGCMPRLSRLISLAPATDYDNAYKWMNSTLKSRISLTTSGENVLVVQG